MSEPDGSFYRIGQINGSAIGHVDTQTESGNSTDQGISLRVWCGIAIGLDKCDPAVVNLFGSPEFVPSEAELLDVPAVMGGELFQSRLSIQAAGNGINTLDKVTAEPVEPGQGSEEIRIHYLLFGLRRMARRVWLRASSSSSSRCSISEDRSEEILLRILATSWVPFLVI